MPQAQRTDQAAVPGHGTRCCAAWEQKFSAAGLGFALNCCGCAPGGRILRAVAAPRFVRRGADAANFRPYADSVARVALVTRTQARRGRQLALAPAVVRLELYLLWVV